jgi:hypothetical protein
MTAFVGVADHAGWAVTVTATASGELLDRRRIELVAEGLPKLPHHHDAQGLPLDEGLALIERVRVSAEEHAKLALEAIAAAVSVRIVGIAMRACPPLPATVAERLSNYRAQNVADSVMFRTALADAAVARGWGVHWYEARKVIPQACQALQVESLEPQFAKLKKELGPPWTQDHRMALAAAIVAHAGR